jgi:hypothetical protein
MTWTALPITTAGRFSPLGPLGMSSPRKHASVGQAPVQQTLKISAVRPAYRSSIIIAPVNPPNTI